MTPFLQNFWGSPYGALGVRGDMLSSTSPISQNFIEKNLNLHLRLIFDTLKFFYFKQKWEKLCKKLCTNLYTFVQNRALEVQGGCTPHVTKMVIFRYFFDVFFKIFLKNFKKMKKMCRMKCTTSAASRPFF